MYNAIFLNDTKVHNKIDNDRKKLLNSLKKYFVIRKR